MGSEGSFEGSFEAPKKCRTLRQEKEFGEHATILREGSLVWVNELEFQLSSAI